MQTFLPYANFQKSARCLDRQRLGKQRVEGLQILQCLLNIGSQRWQQHPAVIMWKGAELSLAHYVLEVCHEWTSRGYKDTVAMKVVSCLQSIGQKDRQYRQPTWLGNRKFHQAHRSNLVRKSPTHYRQYFPKIENNLPYVWPKGQREKRKRR